MAAVAAALDSHRGKSASPAHEVLAPAHSSWAGKDLWARCCFLLTETSRLAFNGGLDSGGGLLACGSRALGGQ